MAYHQISPIAVSTESVREAIARQEAYELAEQEFLADDRTNPKHDDRDTKAELDAKLR